MIHREGGGGGINRECHRESLTEKKKSSCGCCVQAFKTKEGNIHSLRHTSKNNSVLNESLRPVTLLKP